MTTNEQIVNKAAISTGDLAAGGILNAEQAKKFIVQTFEKTVLGNLIRHEQRTATSGEIDKIGIDKRILRAKTEGTDDNYRAKANLSKIQYNTTPVRLPWEINEESLRQNIEGQNFESIVTDLMTTQLGLDREDLLMNGDAAVAPGSDDYDFLKVNDGWYKLLKNNAFTDNRTSVGSGAMSIAVFYDALRKIPNKFNNGNLRWLMSPARAQKWEEYLLNLMVTAGGGVTDSVLKQPAGIPIVRVPSMPNDSIVLTDPKNLIAVDTYNVIIRKTTEGREAVMQDKRFYVVHFDFDAIVEEYTAACVTYGLAAI